MREFIETGEPVGSRELCRKHDFEVKDATVRNEFNALMRDGFLSQTHTSSGRVPTDKAYRFWVDELMEQAFQNTRAEFGRMIQDMEDEFQKHDFGDFVHDVADDLEMLGVGYAPRAGHLYKSGLDSLFHQLMEDAFVSDPQEMYQVVEDFEMLDRRMSGLLGATKSGERPKVFIGKSPITKSRQLSVVADKYEIGGDEFVLAAVGPKRMDYGRAIGFFKQLRKVLDDE